jgi:alpha-ribazole phosphatase
MALAQALPPGVRVRLSPKLRCVQLAKGLQHLRPELHCHNDVRLVEKNFGQWEGQRWDAINKAEIGHRGRMRLAVSVVAHRQ